MARKYTRDNRGRFASVGATARGGRLKTAGGGKRQTQTMRASRRNDGTIIKDRAARVRARSESGRLRIAAARATKEGQRSFNAGGTVVAEKMRRKADRLDRISAHDNAQKAAAKAAAKKRAKPAEATGTRRDANRLKTLNNRLRYYDRNGYTPDDLSVVATRSARNALASSMIAKGGQRVTVRTRSEATKAQRGRTRLMLDAGNAAAKLNQSTGVKVQMQNGYGLRKVVEKRSQARMFGNPTTWYQNASKQPGTTVTIPVAPGGGRRLKGRTVGAQGGLFGGSKPVKVFRPTSSRPKRRR